MSGTPCATVQLRGKVQMKESSRFLKKAAQKLLLCWVMGCVTDTAHDPA
jgi:hypothetical protein